MIKNIEYIIQALIITILALIVFTNFGTFNEDTERIASLGKIMIITAFLVFILPFLLPFLKRL